MKKPQKNQIFTCEITDISNLGYGICHIDGMVGFVAGGVTGDRLKVKVIKVARDYLVLRVEEMITPSPHRITSDCPVSKSCGGCIYRHISYEYEKSLKQNYIEGVFAKQGLKVNVAKLFSNDKTSAYRNKVQYPVCDGKMGYYKVKSHEIIECDNCLLESDESRKITDLCAEYVRSRDIKKLRHICVRRGFATGEIMVTLVLYDRDYTDLNPLIESLKKNKAVKTITVNINPNDTNVILGRENITVYGNGYIEDRLLGSTFRIGPMSFYQVNHDMAEALYGKVIELCDLKDGEKFTDLYCGVGTIGLCVAKSVKNASLIGIEIVPEAVENAKINAEINGITNAEFICGDASRLAEIKSDLVIVDPPRKGLTEELIDKIASSSANRVVYVSCGPDTLARDLKYFAEKGFAIGTVYPFDLFPRTGHVETVVLLSGK